MLAAPAFQASSNGALWGVFQLPLEVGVEKRHGSLCLAQSRAICYTAGMGNHRAGRLTLFFGGATLQTEEGGCCQWLHILI